MDRISTPEEIQDRMKVLRKRMRRQVGFAADDARQLISWKGIVARHPLASVGIALAIGYAVVPRLKILGFGQHDNSAIPSYTERLSEKVPNRLGGLGSMLLRGVVSAAVTVAMNRAKKFFSETVESTSGGENSTVTNGRIFVPHDANGQP